RLAPEFEFSWLCPLWPRLRGGLLRRRLLRDRLRGLWLIRIRRIGAAIEKQGFGVFEFHFHNFAGIAAGLELHEHLYSPGPFAQRHDANAASVRCLKRIRKRTPSTKPASALHPGEL